MTHDIWNIKNTGASYYNLSEEVYYDLIREIEGITCDCGAPTRLCKAKTGGLFLGCVTFPTCKKTHSIKSLLKTIKEYHQHDYDGNPFNED